jgi:hypothetical protein
MLPGEKYFTADENRLKGNAMLFRIFDFCLFRGERILERESVQGYHHFTPVSLSMNKNLNNINSIR